MRMFGANIGTLFEYLVLITKVVIQWQISVEKKYMCILVHRILLWPLTVNGNKYKRQKNCSIYFLDDLHFHYSSMTCITAPETYNHKVKEICTRKGLGYRLV